MFPVDGNVFHHAEIEDGVAEFRIDDAGQRPSNLFFGDRHDVILPVSSSNIPGVDRLGVFKALGDNTRYAIYLELARSETPL
ncbi:MAG TPA: hypothetical protein VHD87_08810, partial [Acidimicrobiales bacterium]|nr:hypothetical protein [Acidimicrobiales bacterium]